MVNSIIILFHLEDYEMFYFYMFAHKPSLKIIHNQMVKEKGQGRKVQANNLRRVKKRRIEGKITNTEGRNQVVLKDLEF